jgi:hypothetical protein
MSGYEHEEMIVGRDEHPTPVAPQILERGEGLVGVVIDEQGVAQVPRPEPPSRRITLDADH